MWCRILKPEITHHLSVVPESVCHATYQRECRRTRTSLAISDDLLDESLILGSFAIVEWWWFHDLTTCQPNECLRTQEASGQIEIDFVRKSVSEYFVQVRGNVCCGRMVGMVIRMTMGRRSGDDERKRYDSPFGREYQRILDHGTCPSIVVRVLRRFDTVVLCKRGHGGVSRLVILDHVNRGFQCLVVHGRRKGWRVIKPDQDSNVEELVFVDSEIVQN